jgi:hypothetical protein
MKLLEKHLPKHLRTKNIFMDNYFKYDYINKDGDTFRILPALADIQNALKVYKTPKDSIYIVDLIGDTLKNVDMGLYNSTVKFMKNSVYGSFGTSFIFGKEESPQEKRNKARTSFQKKLSKIRNM